MSSLMNWLGSHPVKSFAIIATVAITLLFAGLIPPSIANVLIIIPGFRAVFSQGN